MKIKKFLPYFLLAFLSISLSSCFEIIEEITIRKDGSGEVLLTINLSQSKTKLASIMLLDSINGYKVPNEKVIHKELNKAVAYLRKMKGISNVSTTADFDNFIATIRFSFNDISNMNQILKNVMAMQKIKLPNQTFYSYNPKNRLFVRRYQNAGSTISEFNKLKSKDKEVFKTAKFISITRFDSPVATITNKAALISKSKKAVMLKANVMDLIYDKINISDQIQLQK